MAEAKPPCPLWFWGPAALGQGNRGWDLQDSSELINKLRALELESKSTGEGAPLPWRGAPLP
jgi:hypothetical protein